MDDVHGDRCGLRSGADEVDSLTRVCDHYAAAHLPLHLTVIYVLNEGATLWLDKTRSADGSYPKPRCVRRNACVECVYRVRQQLALRSVCVYRAV